jgi:Flp pilus assembly protein TadG
MKNSNGQALVEFVLILPVILIILMYLIDASKIISYKTSIENDMNMVVNLYQNKEALNKYIADNNIDVSYVTDNNLTTITIKKDTKYTLPSLNNILGRKIEAKRVVYEQ